MGNKVKKSTEELLEEVSEKLDKILVAVAISNKNERDQIKILKNFKNKWSLRNIEKWFGIDRHKFSKKLVRRKKK